MKLPLILAGAIALAFGGAAYAGPAEDIVAAEKCNKCHTATTTKKGPSWASLAEKYKDKADMPAKLAQMLKTGVPLSGKTGEDDQHKKLTASDADIKAVVNLVLSTK
jgi:cytochrome c